MSISHRALTFSFLAFLSVVLNFIVTSAEVFFQPNVKADEQIAAAHFFDL